MPVISYDVLQECFFTELGDRHLAASAAEELCATFSDQSFAVPPSEGLHPLAPQLIGWPARALDLLSLVRALRAAHGASSSVVGRLAVPREFDGAFAEARCARWLQSSGFAIEISETKIGGPDFIVLNGGPLRVEVRALHPASESTIEDVFLFELVTRSPQLIGSGFEVYLELGGDRLSVLGAHSGAARSRAIALAAEDAITRLRPFLRPKRATVSLPGLGVAEIVPIASAPNTAGGWSISGQSALGVTKKIITAGHDKAKQLAGNRGLLWFDVSPVVGRFGLEAPMLKDFGRNVQEAMVAGPHKHVEAVALYRGAWKNANTLEERVSVVRNDLVGMRAHALVRDLRKHSSQHRTSVLMATERFGR